MKKIVWFFFTIFLISCSKSDDDSSSSPAKNTIKRISETIYYSSSTQQNNANFNYDNGILKSIIVDGGTNKGEFIYNGTKIIGYNFYTNNVLENSYNFNYSGDNLVEIISDEGKSTFEYVNNKLSSKKEYFISGSSYVLVEQKDYNYIGNNVNTEIVMSNYTGNPSYFKVGYDYDNKNDILKNMNPYLKYCFSFESTVDFSFNNAIFKYNYDSITSSNKTQSHSYIITYNNDNFPVNIKKYRTLSNGNVGGLQSEMNIEYN